MARQQCFLHLILSVLYEELAVLPANAAGVWQMMISLTLLPGSPEVTIYPTQGLHNAHGG